MTDTTRRIFIARSLAGGCAVAGLGLATSARAATHVEETDETAVGLGYHHDTTLADQKKYPAHTPQQRCVERRLAGPIIRKCAWEALEPRRLLSVTTTGTPNFVQEGPAPILAPR